LVDSRPQRIIVTRSYSGLTDIDLVDLTHD